MKSYLLIISCCALLSACQPFSLAQEEKPAREEPMIMDKEVVEPNWKTVETIQLDNEVFFSISSFINNIDGILQFDPIHKTLNMIIDNNHYYMIYGVPVLRVNGLLLPDSSYTFEMNNNEPWLPIHFLSNALGLTINKVEGSNSLEYSWEEGPAYEENKVEEAVVLGDLNQIIFLMDEFQNPIKGAMVDTIRSHLPGARREYRNGYHEGMDWYGFSSGVPMNRQTEVFAMGNGLVVRADHTYNKYKSVEERNADLKVAAEAKETPEYILDKLRGRQVWIQYENGLQARFSHLDRIAEDLAVGDAVTSETLIGYVGNTGTSGDVKNNDTELHLHLDLLYKGELFWKGLTQEEVISVLKSAFSEEV